MIPIHIPPLRERKEDIPLLVQHFVDKSCSLSGKCVGEVSPEGIEAHEGSVRLARERARA